MGFTIRLYNATPAAVLINGPNWDYPESLPSGSTASYYSNDDSGAITATSSKYKITRSGSSTAKYYKSDAYGTWTITNYGEIDPPKVYTYYAYYYVDDKYYGQNSTTTISSSGAGIYVSVDNPTKSGYKFLGWGSDHYKQGDTIRVTNLKNYYYADLEQVGFWVIGYNVNGGIGTAPASQTATSIGKIASIANGSYLYVTYDKKTTYSVNFYSLGAKVATQSGTKYQPQRAYADYWTKDSWSGAKIEFGNEYWPTSNITAYAHYPNNYVDYGSPTYSGVGAPSDPTRDYYKFIGWFEEGVSTAVSFPYKGLGPLYAGWEKLEYSVSLSKNKNNSTDIEVYKTITKKWGESFTLDETAYAAPNWVITTPQTVKFDFNGGSCESKSTDTRSYNKTSTSTFKGSWYRLSGHDYGNNKLTYKTYEMATQNASYLAQYNDPTYEYTDLTDVPSPTKLGFTFVGYASVDQEYTYKPSEFDLIKKNPELFPSGLVAVWTWNNDYIYVRITTVDNEGHSINVPKYIDDNLYSEPIIVKKASKIKLTAGDDILGNYLFNNWTYKWGGVPTVNKANPATISVPEKNSIYGDGNYPCTTITLEYGHKYIIAVYSEHVGGVWYKSNQGVQNDGYVYFTTKESTPDMKKGHKIESYSVGSEGSSNKVTPGVEVKFKASDYPGYAINLHANWIWDDDYVIVDITQVPSNAGWITKILEDTDRTYIFKIGDKVTLSATRLNNNYDFYNWSYEYYGHNYWNGAVRQWTVPGARSNHTVDLKANFKRNCKITYYGKDGEQLGSASYYVIDDDGYVTFTTREMTTSYDGYKFVDYSIEGYTKKTTPQKTTVMVKAPSSYEIKVYSNWEKIKYSISVKTDPEFKGGKRLSSVNVYRQSKQAWDTTKSGLDYWSDSTLEYGDLVQVTFDHTSTYVKSVDSNGWSSTLTTISYIVKYSSVITATYDELYRLHIKQNGAKGDVFVSINGVQTKPDTYGILQWWWNVKSSDTIKITWSSSEYFPKWGGDDLELFNKNSSTLELTNKGKITSNIDITCDWASPQYYYVKSNNTDWGTVYPKNDSSDPAKAHAPDKIVIQATPKPGYKFNSFSYYDKNRKFRVKYHTVCSEYEGTYYCSIDPSDFSTNKSDPTKISATFAKDKLTLKLCQEGSGGVSYSIDGGSTTKLTRDNTIIELDPGSTHIFEYSVDTTDVERFKKVVIAPWNGTTYSSTVSSGKIILSRDNYTIRFYFVDARGDLYVDPVIRYSSSAYTQGSYDGGLLNLAQGYYDSNGKYVSGDHCSVLISSIPDWFPHNTYEGECTWYAHYRSGQMRGNPGAGAPYGSGETPSHLWNNANEWPGHHGGNWTLEGDIQVGDVAIEGWANSNHVLVVEAIDSDGTITMSHFNHGGDHCYNALRTVYWEDRDRYIFLHNTVDKVISSGTGKPVGHTAISGVKEADCGYVTGGAENMIYGQETTIEAHPNSGYEFKYWITPTGSKEFTDILTIVMTDEGKSGVYTAVITKVGDEDPIEDGEEVPTYYTEFTATTYGCIYEDDVGQDMWNYDFKNWVIGTDTNAYTQLNYIKSSKDVGQYLTTYWHGNIFCKLVIDGQFTSLIPYQYMGSNGSPENFCFGLDGSGKLRFNDSNTITIDTDRHVFEVNGNGYCKFDNEVVYMTPLDRTQGRYINLFSRDGYIDDGTDTLVASKMASDFKLYACKIYDDGELVRDFIPAKRKRDGKVGLWENVYKEFYYDNKNNFEAGEEKGELNKWDQ